MSPRLGTPGYNPAISIDECAEPRYARCNRPRADPPPLFPRVGAAHGRQDYLRPTMKSRERGSRGRHRAKAAAQTMETFTASYRFNPSTHRFAFATGIENSYPVITGRDGRPVRVDEMAKAQHYARWREDFALVREMGLTYLRYGPPYYQTHRGPGRYDWEFADATLGELRRLGI